MKRFFILINKILPIILCVSIIVLNPMSNAKGLIGKKIMLDPGHGGSDPGAVGPTGLTEKSVNLRVAYALKAILEQNGGATVSMTRWDDRYISLAQRTNTANSWGAHRFISIHHNANVNRSINGTQVFSAPNASKLSIDLRNKIQNRLLSVYKLKNLGALTGNYYVIKHTRMPAVLTEASFISNPYEEARLKNPSYTWKQAKYIYMGIADHYGVKP